MKIGIQTNLKKMDYLNRKEGGVPKDTARMLMEHAGIDFSDETSDANVLVCAIGDNVFQLSEEFVEYDGDIYIPISNLEDNVFESIQDSIDPIVEVKLDEDTYVVTEDVFEVEGEAMVMAVLQEEAEEVDAESDEDLTLTVNETTYNIVENEEDATSYAYLVECEDGYEIVDSEEDAEFIAYLSEE